MINKEWTVYDGLVICHPKEYCTTWDFCTHYAPHNKGVACSCDSCEPCDFDTVVDHRKNSIAQSLSVNNAEWMEWCDKECSNPKHFCLGFLQRECVMCWEERKKEIGS